jgi:hypothetical protein
VNNVKKTPIERMWSSFRRLTKGYRVADEFEDMIGKVFVGRILFEFLRVLVDLVLLISLMVLIHHDLEWLLPVPECVRSCFVASEEACCPLNLSFVFRVIVFLSGIVLGSYLSTHFKRKKKLRHSTSVTAFFIIFAVVYLVLVGMPGWLVLLCAITIFMAMFQGYSLNFRG